jgi:hypothetical protein
MIWEVVTKAGAPGTESGGFLQPLAKLEQSSFFWIDYFCLRQNQWDFDIDAVVAVMNQMDAVVAVMTKEHGYLDRAFCVLELFAAIRAKKQKEAAKARHQEESKDGMWDRMKSSANSREMELLSRFSVHSHALFS